MDPRWQERQSGGLTGPLPHAVGSEWLWVWSPRGPEHTAPLHPKAGLAALIEPTVAQDF